MEFITAKIAQEKTLEIIQHQMKCELDIIYSKIDEAIQRGEYEARLSDWNICSDTENFLIEKGFSVDKFYGDQRDPANDLVISWYIS